MKSVFRKNLSSLVPADEQALDMLAKIKHGDMVFVEVKRGRNVAHHRLFFAMLNLVFVNQWHYRSVDELLAAFKLAIGHVDVVRTRRGDIYIPRSISFASMDQSEFDMFYQRAIDFMINDVIPGLDRADLERELMEFAA